MTLTPQSWARDLLTRMGYPVSANNMTTVLAWEYAEGGQFQNSAHYNPLNTTMAHARYGSINSAGVASYPDYETGMRETIATLRLPAYARIRSDLHTSAPPRTTTAAIAASPWGTWHGASPAPIVARAARDVHDHPGWVSSGKAKPEGRAPKQGNGSSGTEHNGASGAGTGGKVVLDLAELGRLSSVFADASDRALAIRRKVAQLADELLPACNAVPQQYLGQLIHSTLGDLAAPRTGFDSNGRQLHDISEYTGSIRRLAEEADSNHNGTWGLSEKLRFVEKHPDSATDPAVRAVTEALLGGTIHRSMTGGAARPAGRPSPEHGKSGKPANGGNGGGQHGAGTHPSTRTRKIDKMLTLANSQHVHESGVNRTKYGAWFGNNGQPWCADFVSWVFAHSGNPLPAIQGPHGFAYVPYAITYAREHGQLHTNPHLGDIFLLKDGSHTGIVSKVYANGTFDTVEGNEGDMVAHVHRNSHDGSYYFWTAIR